ncbi:hypothetical protein HAX54_012047 [Datura stramonium]|uniref:Uncharacterized protein n=1 Tax=Datura stramonium TaxID=4076 RepID=A0ABS8TJ58_DATST|nr:hypothetical protein [Datura stramonium]
MAKDLMRYQIVVLRIPDEVSFTSRPIGIANYLGPIVSPSTTAAEKDKSLQLKYGKLEEALAFILDQSSLSGALARISSELDMLRNEWEVVSNEGENHQGDTFTRSMRTEILQRENASQDNLIEYFET